MVLLLIALLYPVVPESDATCITGGCSNQLCISADSEPLASTCEWREEYACYQEYGTCELQSDASCGWTPSPELAACLEGAAAHSSPN